MKRIGLWLVAPVALICCGSLQALYNGNPAAPEIIDEGLFIPSDFCLSAKAGYQGDFVFGKKLRAYDGASGRIDTFRAQSNQGVVVLNVNDTYEFYGSAGAMHTFISHRPHVDDARREYDTNNPFTWGAGARAIFFHWGHTDLGVDGKYQRTNADVKRIKVDGETFTTSATFTYEEWQLGLGLSQHIDLFTPYAAVRFADPHAKIRRLRPDVLPHSHFVMKTRHNWGLSLGCTLSSAKRFDFTVEARLFDEEALTLTGNIKF